jgi:hypothetical protein
MVRPVDAARAERAARLALLGAVVSLVVWWSCGDDDGPAGQQSDEPEVLSSSIASNPNNVIS